MEERAEQGERVVGAACDVAQVLAGATPVDDLGDAGHGDLAREADQIAGVDGDRVAVEHLEGEPRRLLVVVDRVQGGDPSPDRIAELAFAVAEPAAAVAEPAFAGIPACAPGVRAVRRAIHDPAVRPSAAPSPGTSVGRRPGGGTA